MRMYRILIILAILIFSLTVLAQDKEESGGKFSGYVFGDYYHITKNHKSDILDKHGFWFRRIYFTYDYKINNNFSTRLRLEMSNEGDFTSKIAMIPFVKDAWLKYKLDLIEFILGISPPPTFAVIEKIWSYRSVEKTPLDLQKMASSRDFGLSIKGKFDKNGVVKYHLMFSNGSSNKQEIDKGKSGMLSLGLYPSKEWVFEIYADYADRIGDTDWYTLQAFIGYVTKQFQAGIQYADQTHEKAEDVDEKLRVASIFLARKISKQFSLFGRIDKTFDPNPNGDDIAFIPFDPSAKSTFFLAGLDWQPVKHVSIIPNIEFVKYEENSDGMTPGSDLISRITFYWKFK
jgi:hypothetical protein